MRGCGSTETRLWDAILLNGRFIDFGCTAHSFDNPSSDNSDCQFLVWQVFTGQTDGITRCNVARYIDQELRAITFTGLQDEESLYTIEDEYQIHGSTNF